jgi:hypothetical protein
VRSLRSRKVVRGWLAAESFSMKVVSVSLLCWWLLAAVPGRTELPSFDDFFRGVSECTLNLSRYSDVQMNADAEAVLITLPAAGSVRGFLITTFYFSPAREGHGEDYGLVFNAPIEQVADAFPEFAARETVHGYLRRLRRLSDETSDRRAERQTLLVCSGGTET